MSVIATLADVHFEVDRQTDLWGEQNHPDGTSYIDFGDFANNARQHCDEANDRGELTWAHILTEEYGEAMAEEDPQRLYVELEQVAAVATSWMVALKRRGVVRP